MTAMQSRPNALSTVANAISERSALIVSLLARIVGASGALYIASDQSYDRTQAFCVLLAVLAVASAYPYRGTVGAVLGGIGAGLLFFGGAALFEQTTGVVLVVVGIVAAGATVVTAYRADKLAAFVIGFFCGAAVIVALVVAIALLVEG